MNPIRSLVRTVGEIPARFGRITTHRAYFSQLDGLRTAALLPVLIWHAGLRADRMIHTPTRHFIWGHLLPNGEAGVDLFFAISGLIIALPFFRKPEQQYQQLGKFYKRRLTRLGPPYALILLLCFCFLSLTHYAPADALRFNLSKIPLWQSFTASFFYVHGLVFNAPPKLNPPLWSLEVEAQFYLIAPLLLLAYVAAKRVSSRQAFIVPFLCLLLTTFLSTGTHADQPQGHTIVAFLPFFLAGVACVPWIGDGTARSGFVAADALAVVGYLVLWASGRFQSETAFAPVLARDAVRLVCIGLVLFGTLRGSLFARLLAHRWVSFVGVMCYSIYLVHVPLMQMEGEVLHRLLPRAGEITALLASYAVLIPSSLAAGFLFYLLVERPCMDPNWPQRLAAVLRGKSADAIPAGAAMSPAFEQVGDAPAPDPGSN